MHNATVTLWLSFLLSLGGLFFCHKLSAQIALPIPETFSHSSALQQSGSQGATSKKLNAYLQWNNTQGRAEKNYLVIRITRNPHTENSMVSIAEGLNDKKTMRIVDAHVPTSATYSYRLYIRETANYWRFVADTPFIRFD